MLGASHSVICVLILTTVVAQMKNWVPAGGSVEVEPCCGWAWRFSSTPLLPFSAPCVQVKRNFSVSCQAGWPHAPAALPSPQP